MCTLDLWAVLYGGILCFSGQTKGDPVIFSTEMTFAIFSYEAGFACHNNVQTKLIIKHIIMKQDFELVIGTQVWIEHIISSQETNTVGLLTSYSKANSRSRFEFHNTTSNSTKSPLVRLSQPRQKHVHTFCRHRSRTAVADR